MIERKGEGQRFKDFAWPTEQRFFFTSNQGFGMFELQMPISVPDDCWNTGTNTDDHKECKDAPAATLTYEVELLDFSAEDDAGHV